MDGQGAAGAEAATADGNVPEGGDPLKDQGPYKARTGETVNQVHSPSGSVGSHKGMSMNRSSYPKPSGGKTVNQVHSSAGTIGEDKGLRMNQKACKEIQGGSK